MIIFHLITLIVSVICLGRFLLKTRSKDTPIWWCLRLLLSYSLICLVFMLFDVNHAIDTETVFIRSGFFCLSVAFLLVGFLLKIERRRFKKELFMLKAKKVFK